jgi:peroxiredoxin/outer membrane lipoprotein-sorting protein
MLLIFAQDSSMRRSLLLSSALLLALNGALASTVDDASREALAPLVASLNDADGWSVRLKIFSAPKEDPKQLTERASFDVAAKAPNQFARHIFSDGKLMEIRLSDGKELFVYLQQLNAYEQGPAPAAFQDLLAVDPFTNFAIIPLLLLENGVSAVADELGAITLAGKTGEGDSTTTRLAFKNEDTSYGEIVLGANGQLLSISRFHDSQPISVTYQFTDWKDAATPEQFVFTAPEGAKKVDSIREAVDGAATPDSPQALVGQAAPPFVLPNLAGEKLDLATLKGKVVVLDFWATWCGPCVRGLPGVAELAKSQKEADVEVFAVNLREDAETITEFLTKQKLEIPVLMDAEGAVAQTYRVSGIPQTVIIDRAGVVRFVEVGLMPKEELLKQIQAIAAKE